MFVIVDGKPSEGKWLIRDGEESRDPEVLACCHTQEAAEFVATCVNIVGRMADALVAMKAVHLLKKKPKE